ncbi:hypothetical protein CTI12_AA547410 [Artemisia annua]|uniref:Uncharacterized protein n=1 Tax=Artemisia annua TaxID=35608 RepID=A0A2U1KZJ5_ARTAN|nr:hypothetical protein CTI12_AA547410 [Artemisia annua]
MDGLDGGKSSSFIKIHGPDERGSESTQTSTLEASVTNLMVSDYIKNFHERNKHEAVSLVLPPPPRVPPHGLVTWVLFLLQLVCCYFDGMLRRWPRLLFND